MNKLQMLKTRAQLLAAIRQFFAERNFMEVDTPALVPLPSQEPYLSPMEVNFSDVRGNPLKWYLTTSPEFAIKKLLSMGARNVYQLSHVFRGGEAFGGTHNPEFMMLEWYRTPGDYNDIMQDVEELINFVFSKVLDPGSGAGMTDGWRGDGDPMGRSRDEHRWGESRDRTRHEPIRSFKKFTVTEAFKQFGNLETANFNEADWIDTAKKFGHNVATPDDAFFALFLNLVENKLPQDEPIFIKDYPLFQAALAKVKDAGALNAPNTPLSRVAERFELYWGGLELANAFSELVDAESQEARIKKDQDSRRQLGKPIIPIDPEFIAALKKGFPPTGGIALGVDRLLMLLTGAKDINEVLPFPANNLKN